MVRSPCGLPSAGISGSRSTASRLSVSSTPSPSAAAESAPMATAVKQPRMSENAAGINKHPWRWISGERANVESLLHRAQAELVHQHAIAVALRISRGEKLRTEEDRIGAGEKAQRLRLLAHVFAAGGEPHNRTRHGDTGHSDSANEFEWTERRLIGERGAGNAG